MGFIKMMKSEKHVVQEKKDEEEVKEAAAAELDKKDKK